MNKSGAIGVLMFGLVSGGSALADGRGLNLQPPPPADSPGAEQPRDLGPGVHELGRLGPPAWTVQVEPMIWWVLPSGKLKLPATSGTGGPTGGGFADSGDKLRVERLNLDTPRFGPAGELHVNADKFRFTFGGINNSIARDRTIADSSFRLGSVEVAAGDALNVEYDLSAFELTVGYQVWGRDFAICSGDPALCTEAGIRVYALGGARFTDFSLDVNRLGGAPASAGVDEFFVEPIIGFRAEVELARDFTIDALMDGGYFADSDRSSFSLNVAVAFAWRPHPNVGIQIGWRQLAFSLTDGDDSPANSRFEYDGRLAGLFTGVVIRF